MTSSLTDQGGGQQFQAIQLLPVARTKYLADNWKTDHVGFKGLIGWLIVEAVGVTEGSTVVTVPPVVDLYIIKTAEDAGGPGLENTNYFPYQEPEAPGNLTNWSSDANTQDGLDPFLWTSRLYLNGDVNQTVTSLNFGNTVPVPTPLQEGGIYRFPGQMVQTRPFEPNVVIRTKRRLDKNEGLIMGMTWPTTNSQITMKFSMAYRMLMG